MKAVYNPLAGFFNLRVSAKVCFSMMGCAERQRKLSLIFVTLQMIRSGSRKKKTIRNRIVPTESGKRESDPRHTALRAVCRAEGIVRSASRILGVYVKKKRETGVGPATYGLRPCVERKGLYGPAPAFWGYMLKKSGKRESDPRHTAFGRVSSGRDCTVRLPHFGGIC